MTTIDYQQAAVQAVADALHGDACPCDPDPGEACDCGSWDREAEIALTAASPHLRAGIAEEVRALWAERDPDGTHVSFTPFHSGYSQAVEDVLALLEGGGEPFSAHDEKGHDQQKCCCLEKRWTGLCGHDQEGGGE